MSYLTAADLEPIDDDSAAVSAAAESLRAVAEPLRTASADAESHWQGLGAVYEAPEQGVLFGALAPARAAGDDLATAVEAIAAALAAYAEALTPLEVMDAQLRLDLAYFASQVGAWEGGEADPAASWTSDPALEMRESSLRRTASGLRSAVLDAERDCAAALDAVSGGTGTGLRTVSDARARELGTAASWTAVLSAFDAGVEAAAVTTLAEIARMSEDELEAWVAENDERMHQLIDDPPAADVTAAWWSGLGEAGQALLVASAPLIVGNLDGVPWDRRVEANHNGLRAEIERLDRLIAQAPPEPSERDADALGVWQARRDAYDRLLNDEVTWRDGTGRVQTQQGHHVVVFDPSREALAEYLGFLEEDGTIPASTTSVGTYVPGTYSKPEAFSDTQAVARELVRRGRGEVGMLAWQGGHFPQGLQAVSPTASEDLAPRLARAVDAIPAGPGTTRTTIGYSYGSAVVGLAEKAGMTSDRVLYVSGAGLGHGVESIDEFPETGDVPHFALLAPRDHVVGAIQGLEADPGDVDLGHGASPVKAEGVIRLETGWKDAATGADSGPLTGHGVWARGSGEDRVASTVYDQVFGVVADRPVVPYPADERQTATWLFTPEDELPIVQAGELPPAQDLDALAER